LERAGVTPENWDKLNTTIDAGWEKLNTEVNTIFSSSQRVIKKLWFIFGLLMSENMKFIDDYK
jgi:hypothetical protein